MQRPGTSACLPAIRACLSRMPGNWHVRFLREPGKAMCPAYLTDPRLPAVFARPWDLRRRRRRRRMPSQDARSVRSPIRSATRRPFRAKEVPSSRRRDARAITKAGLGVGGREPADRGWPSTLARSPSRPSWLLHAVGRFRRGGPETWPSADWRPVRCRAGRDRGAVGRWCQRLPVYAVTASRVRRRAGGVWLLRARSGIRRGLAGSSAARRRRYPAARSGTWLRAGSTPGTRSRRRRRGRS